MIQETKESKRKHQYDQQDTPDQTRINALESRSEDSVRSQADAKNNFLLIKNLPKNVTEEEVRALIPETITAISISIISQSSNVYVKYASQNEIKTILKRHAENPIRHEGKALDLCFVTKMPLDLNKTSRIVLVTLYNEKSEINVQIIHDILQKYGKIEKIIIFKRKNYQVLVEFKNSDDAQRFKITLHDVNYEGMFYLKIQFTSKKELIVNSNNLYEYDFTKVEDYDNVFKNFPATPSSQTQIEKAIKTNSGEFSHNLTNKKLSIAELENSSGTKNLISHPKQLQTYEANDPLEEFKNFTSTAPNKSKQLKSSKHENIQTMDEINSRSSKSHNNFDQGMMYNDLNNQFDEFNLKNTESSDYSANNKSNSYRNLRKDRIGHEGFPKHANSENLHQGNNINMFMGDHNHRQFTTHRDEDLKLFSFQNNKTEFAKDEGERAKKRYCSEIKSHQNVQEDFFNYLFRQTDPSQFNQVYNEEFLIFSQSFNLIIEGLSNGFRAKNIFNLFSVYGKIRGIAVLYSKSIAIVGFYSEKEGFNAAVHLNNQLLFNKTLNIEILKSNPFRIGREAFPFEDADTTWNNQNGRRNSVKEIVSEFYELNFEDNFNDGLPLSTLVSSFLLVTILGGYIPIETVANLFDAVENVICIYANTSTANSWILEFSSVQSAMKVIYYFNHLVFIERKVKMGFFKDHHQLPAITENIPADTNHFKVDKKPKETKLPAKVLPNFGYNQTQHRKPDYKYPKI